MTTTQRAEALSIALLGLDAHLTYIEATADPGPSKFELVGISEAQNREARIRVRSALQQIDVDLHGLSITVSVSPDDVPKGGYIDLPIALAVLAAVGRIPAAGLRNIVLLGELALMGGVRSVRGVLPRLEGAIENGITKAIVPRDNAHEAALLPGIQVFVAAQLGDIVRHLSEGVPLDRAGEPLQLPAKVAQTAPDMSDIRGMRSARRALEIAAAGGHGILLIGPAGAGKTALARRMASILPPFTRDEAFDVTAIHSVAGLLPSECGLIQVRPFRAPHHTVSAVGLLGGGDSARPGEVTLAHHGVLFLDELIEFRAATLESLRQSLEVGHVSISRMGMRASFPARPLLVGAVNPCPCGYLSEQSHRCTCSEERIRSYRARLEGPFYDRFDLKVIVPPVDVAQCIASPPGEASSEVRERVVCARAQQFAREPNGRKARTNSELSSEELEGIAVPDTAGALLLAQAEERHIVSAVSRDRVLRVARTIADLEGSDTVLALHIAEAVQVHSFLTVQR
jgi:magnesium chelatase family protein